MKKIFRKINKVLMAILLLALSLSLSSCNTKSISATKDVNETIIVTNEKNNIVNDSKLDEFASYTSKDDVALYIYTYKKLPQNFITKKEAKKLGWDSSKGNLDKVAKGKSIGGDVFGNYEKQLPVIDGRKYYECDIDFNGKKRNAKRIIYADDFDESIGFIYYTEDHYKTFERLY